MLQFQSSAQTILSWRFSPMNSCKFRCWFGIACMLTWSLALTYIVICGQMPQPEVRGRSASGSLGIFIETLNVNFVPFLSEDSNSMSPPRFLQISLQMFKPRPFPFGFRLLFSSSQLNGLIKFYTSLGFTPGPLSMTLTQKQTWLSISLRLDSNSIRPFFLFTYLLAFDTKLSSTYQILSTSPISF